jgi:integrase
MKNDTLLEITNVPISNFRIGNSVFSDDVWDLTPYMPQKSMSPARKKLGFERIKNPEIKHTVKQYMYHKLGQVKPQSAVGTLNSLLPYFVRYCDVAGIHSFSTVKTSTLLEFAIWIKAELHISKRTAYMASFAVEDIIRIGQIKGWDVPADDVLTGATAAEIWGSGKDESSDKTVQPIPDDIFDKIIKCAVSYKKDILTKAGIIIQSQTGLRISEVLSIRSGCLHQPENGPAYLEVLLSKTEKGEPFIHKVFANELVVDVITGLERHTAALRATSGFKELFLFRNCGINVPTALNWSKTRLRTFIRKCDIRDSDGQLYYLKSHQFRATFVKQLITRKIPIAYVMKQFSHVSIEMTCHYLTLKEKEIKDIYSRMILSPDSRIAGMGATKLKSKTDELFRGKTSSDIEKLISQLADTLSFNPLPGGVCLYDYRRGNCSVGDGCFFYDCPNFVTEISFLPVLRKELELMEIEMERTQCLGRERQWQIQYVRYKYLKPLVEKLEAQKNG